jgi:hypothetical protein
MSRSIRAAVTVLCLALQARAGASAVDHWIVQLEVNPTQTTSNTLQKPNNSTGTRFDVGDYAGENSTLGRFSLARTVNWGREGSELRFAIVPFQQSGTQIATSTIRYDGVTFQSGLPLTVLYQFNTYRLTYDLPVWRDVKPAVWEFRVGGTLALRDAQTRLTQPGARANYINYGPVPLFYAFAARRLGHGWQLEADVDAFPAPGGGGLLDTSARAVWSLTPRSALFIGVRYEVGGAEDDSIYTFLHQRSALAGVRFAF